MLDTGSTKWYLIAFEVRVCAIYFWKVLLYDFINCVPLHYHYLLFFPHVFLVKL